MTEQTSTNDMSAFNDVQLGASLDALLFETNFSAAAEDLNEGDSIVTDANRVEPPVMALGDEAERMTLPPPPFANNSPTTAAQRDEKTIGEAISVGTSRASSSSSLVGAAIGNTHVSSSLPLPAASRVPPPAALSKTATPIGKPQLFGKELSFPVPAPPSGGSPAAMPSIPLTITSAGKRKRAPPSLTPAAYAISEDESEKERRRQDRNQREQQRSQQISNQIVVLRSLLEDAEVECKPDKYSTLACVVDYVKDLQKQSSMLDSEHKKLLDTIRQTTEIMSSQYMSVQANSEAGPSSANASDATVVGRKSEEDDQVYVQGLDYRALFRASPFALATTSIDGRFLDVSSGFEKMTKFKREELLPVEEGVSTLATGSADDSISTTSDMSSGNGSSSVETNLTATKNLSLFNVLFPKDMSPVYHAMYDILQQPMNHLAQPVEEPARDNWSKNVRLSRNKEAQVSNRDTGRQCWSL